MFRKKHDFLNFTLSAIQLEDPICKLRLYVLTQFLKLFPGVAIASTNIYECIYLDFDDLCLQANHFTGLGVFRDLLDSFNETKRYISSNNTQVHYIKIFGHVLLHMLTVLTISLPWLFKYLLRIDLFFVWFLFDELNLCPNFSFLDDIDIVSLLSLLHEFESFLLHLVYAVLK